MNACPYCGVSFVNSGVLKAHQTMFPICQQVEEYVERLESVNADLLEACKWFMQSLTDGVLVRDITHDANEDWARRMIDFTMQLNKATCAIHKAEGAK